MNRHSRLWAAFLLGIIVLIGWSAYTGTTRMSADPLRDAETMLRAADALYPASYEVALLHSGPFRPAGTDAAFAELGDRTAREFGLETAEPARDANGHRLYATSGQPPGAGGGRVELALSGWPDGATNITVSWNAPEGADKDGVLAWMRDGSARLGAVGAQAKWMVTIRGSIGALSPEAVKTLRQKIGDVYKAGIVDTYADSGSEIASYSSKRLEPGVRSPGVRINLQVALHRDSIYGTYRLTLASPMIASEL